MKGTIAHDGVRMLDLARMVAWYRTVFEAEVLSQAERLAFDPEEVVAQCG